MQYRLHSHRFAQDICEKVPELRKLWQEIQDALDDITEQNLIDHFKANYEGRSKSISSSINDLIHERLVYQGWDDESALFAEKAYQKGGRWRLDFSKATKVTDHTMGYEMGKRDSGIAVEVAFNHGEAIAWNLLKPVIAAELNHIPQETKIGEGIGVIICATADLKKVGAFDSAVGDYEKFLTYLKPMRNFLTVPIILVGLESPEDFWVRTEKRGKSLVGFIEAGPMPLAKKNAKGELGSQE